MSGRPKTFRQADLTRALRAAQAVGIKVGEFSIDSSGVIVVKSAAEAPPRELTPLQKWELSREGKT